MEVKIIFTDQTEIMAEANGDCYITDEQPELPEDLSVVIVQEIEPDPEPEPIPLMTKTLHDVIVQECASVDGRYWFALIEKPASQKEKEDLLAELEAQAEAIVELAELIGGQE